MPWTEELPSGNYRAGYRIPGGHKRYVEGTFTHKRAAQNAAARAEDDAQKLGWRDPRAAERTWGEWFDEWSAGYYAEASTRRTVESMARSRIRPKWGETPLAEITRFKLKAWAVELRDDGLAATSVKRIISALSTSLTAAVDAEILPANPALNLRLGIPDNLNERVLTPKEQRRLFKAFAAEVDPKTAERDQALFAALLGAAPRWSEAVALEAKHFNWNHGTVRFRQAWDAKNRIMKPYTKGKTRRTVPLADWAAEILEAYVRKHGDGLLFTDASGVPLDYANWGKRHWAPAVARSKLNTGDVEKATRHTLRHTTATEWLEAGLSLAEIATLLGHASITTSERYAHRRSTVREEARTAVRDPRVALPKKAKKRADEASELPANVIQFRARK